MRRPYPALPRQVAVAARRMDRLEALVEELEREGIAGTYAVRMDVCDEASVKEGVKQVTGHLHPSLLFGTRCTGPVGENPPRVDPQVTLAVGLRAARTERHRGPSSFPEAHRPSLM